MLAGLKSLGLKFVDQKRKVAWVYVGSSTATGRLCSSTFGSFSRIKSLYDISGTIPLFSRTRISRLCPSRFFAHGLGKKFSTSDGNSDYNLNGGLVMECQHLSSSIIGIPEDPFTSSSLIEIYIVLVSLEMPQSRSSCLPTGDLLIYCKHLTLDQMLSLFFTGRGLIN